MQTPSGPEPSPPPREGLPLAGSFTSSFGLLFGGIWAAAGTLVFLGATLTGAPFWDDWILDRRAVTVTAVPVRSHALATRVNRVTVHEVTYRYRDARGAPHEGVVRVPGGRREAFEVEYDPTSPTRARVKGERASVFGLGVLLPLAFALVGGWITLRGLRARRRERALYRNGTATAAKVHSVEATGARLNGRDAYRVHFIFHTPDGAVRTSCTTLSPPEPKETVWVIYDPTEPEHAMLA